jgi:hypothetical protein
MIASLARPPAQDVRPATLAAQSSPDEAADVRLEPEDWAVVADLVGPVDWDTAGAAGLTIAPGDAELAVLSLTEEEQREFVRLLAGELDRSKS